uniref:Uncharacterized protein n=1 Tax=Neobodo designis TaxID=312471 RepID=A0A6U4P7X8_NEODS|mmetsp:Transcript_12723/g.39557  ORF Transcript_12723/g.39557 Transcript_12723/m.39557 type:complete len:292 (+) Transcript_12723:59-934(+)
MANARQLSFLTSGERDSCVEHLVHVARLHNVESVQFPKNKPFEAPPPSSAMLHRHERRAREEEDRIRRENHILWEKIESQARYGEKLQRQALDKIRQQKESYAGSNIHRRTLEAKRIDKANRQLYERICNAPPRVETRDELTASAAHQTQQARQKRKFKSTAHFPQPPRRPIPDEDDDKVDLTPRRADGTPRLPRVGSARGLSPSNQGSGREVGPGWNAVTAEDIRKTERARDRKLKGHPPPGESTVGHRQRTHNPSGWCDRDAAHKAHTARVARMQQEQEEDDAMYGTAQ